MSVVWFNGDIIKGPLAIDPQDRGLLLGDGLFETVAVVKGKPLWLAQHLARLHSGAAELGMTYSTVAVELGVAQVLSHMAANYAALRITVTRGAAGRGLAADNAQHGSLLVTGTTMLPAMLFQPATLATVATRRNAQSVSSRLKTLSYMDNILAAREAAALGAEDALMLNGSGHVACSSIGNIIVLKGQRLITPSLDQGILPGIMRALIIELAPSAGLVVEQREVFPEELPQSDGVFICNSLRFLRPVSMLDGAALATGNGAALSNALVRAAKLQCGHEVHLL